MPLRFSLSPSSPFRPASSPPVSPKRWNAGSDRFSEARPARSFAALHLGDVGNARAIAIGQARILVLVSCPPGLGSQEDAACQAQRAQAITNYLHALGLTAKVVTTRDAFLSLRLNSGGMEFASEMVIKASLRKFRIAEVPATLSPDLRDRPPHLRPWRDGWRHLRYLLMRSPTWTFGVPGLAAIGLGVAVLAVALLHALGVLAGPGPFGASWTIVAGFLVTCGHFAAIMALTMHLHGVREGYRLLRPSVRRIAPLLTLEMMLSVGLVLIGLSLAGFATIAYLWSADNFVSLPSVLPLVLAFGHGDEVRAEEHAPDALDLEQARGKRRSLALLRVEEFERAVVEHRPAGDELQRGGIGRGLGLDEHLARRWIQEIRIVQIT